MESRGAVPHARRPLRWVLLGPVVGGIPLLPVVFVLGLTAWPEYGVMALITCRSQIAQSHRGYLPGTLRFCAECVANGKRWQATSYNPYATDAQRLAVMLHGGCVYAGEE